MSLDSASGPDFRSSQQVRQEILSGLDRVEGGRARWRTIVVSGMGFLSDAYDLFVISLALPILGYVYFGSPSGIPEYETAAVAAAALFGAVTGQILFGSLADRWGRRRVNTVTLSLMSVASVGSALAGPALGLDTILVIAVWRFLLGVGVGGEYPLSATLMSEYSSTRRRGRQVALVFSMQGLGLLLGAVVTLVTLSILPASGLALAWRIILGFGAVPALATIYFRTRLPETPRFSLSVQGDASAAAEAVGTVTGKRTAPVAPGTVRADRVPLSRFLAAYAPVLFGTASCWFLVDVTYYSSNIFNPRILTALAFTSAGLPIHLYLLRLTEGQILITLIASIPGYYAAVLLIDRWGRRALQAIGFGVMGVSFLLLSGTFQSLGTSDIPLLLGLYGITFFFTNFGPNTTTFVLPSEVFPTPFRARGHGISAASGKMGAAIATFLFPILLLEYHIGFIFSLLGAFALLGLFVTAVFTPEPAGRTLEEVSREDDLRFLVERFSTHLDALTSSLRRGAAELRRLLENPGGEQSTRVPRIRAIEHQADEEVHQVFVDLNSTRYLRTEVRSDVASLTGYLDDIMDGIEGVAARVRTYHLTDPDEGLRRFAELVERCVEQVAQGVDALDELLQGRSQRLQASIVEVNRLENEADDLLRDLLEKLFNDSLDALTVLKMKDFYERLEVITDRCEDVTDVFKDLMVRYLPVT